MLLIMYYMLEAIPSVLHVGGSYATSNSLVAWPVSVNIQSTFVTTQAVNSQLSCMGLLWLYPGIASWMECLCLVAALVIVSYKCEVVLSKFIEAQAWALPSCSLGLGVSDNQVCCFPPGVQSTEASGPTHWWWNRIRWLWWSKALCRTQVQAVRIDSIWACIPIYSRPSTIKSLQVPTTSWQRHGSVLSVLENATWRVAG